MNINVIIGIFIPFIGTAMGAACVFFMKKEINDTLNKALLGLASGVMTAASVWSLLIPALEMSENMGRLAFVPSAAGIIAGMGFLLIIDRIIPCIDLDSKGYEVVKTDSYKTNMLVFAVTLHNIPEGMAVGVAFAGFLSGDGEITMAAAMALAFGIAIQNFPEGSIVSLPLCSGGNSRFKAFLGGVLSGVVEPAAAMITIMFSYVMTPVLPYVLSFAAGAMIYVVVEELIPEAADGNRFSIGTVGFGIGFIIMMMLDVALG